MTDDGSNFNVNKLYFLRGFGVGVIFCVFILGIACAYRTSDSEVIRQAKELGMVFASDAEDEEDLVFASTAPAITATPEGEEKEDDKEEEKEEKTPDPTLTPTPTQVPTPTPETTASPTPDTPTPVPKETKKPKNEKTENDTGKITLQITKGMWSDAVSAALEQKGLVKNAKDFDKFLNNNGYASFIRVGTFQIPKGASYEQIATIITSDN